MPGPPGERRRRHVDAAMELTAGLGERPVAEQVAILSHAQEVLASVLNNTEPPAAPELVTPELPEPQRSSQETANPGTGA